MAQSDFTPAMTRGISNHYLYESGKQPDYIGPMFHQEKMDGAYEDDMTWEGLGLPQEHWPLQDVNLDGIRPSFGYRYIARSWTLGIVIPLEDKQDDLYGIIHKMFPMAGGEFARSYSALSQIIGSQLLGLYGFQAGTSVPFMSDGVSIYNTAHPMSKSNTATTWSNRPSVDADLSVGLAQLARAQLRTQKRPNGIQPIFNPLRRVMVHPNEELLARQIFENPKEPYGNSNNKNYLAGDNVQVVVNPYWEYSGTAGTSLSSFNSVVFQGETHYAKHKKRKELQTFSRFDNNIFADIITTMMREVFGITDPRGQWGSKGN